MHFFYIHLMSACHASHTVLDAGDHACMENVSCGTSQQKLTVLNMTKQAVTGPIKLGTNVKF